MLTAEYYDRLMAGAPEPEWARAERYDYCDQTVATKNDIFHSLSQFFARFFR